MPDAQKFSQYSDDEILNELRRRSRRGTAEQKTPPAGLPGEPVGELIEELRVRQKVIYGVDDRQDLFEVTDQALRDDADTVVSLFFSSDIRDNRDGTSTLATQNFGETYDLCDGEAFRQQPVGAFCTGFLVGEDLIATAAHCVDESGIADIRFVFGFQMASATNPVTAIANSEIYAGAAIVGRVLDGSGPDWALVRLDRPVAGHRVAPVRRSGTIADNQAVHVIGHPAGLPLKVAGGARVRSNTPAAYFVANLDTYGGNSGSPVFNSDTHEVEGILVRGETDFVMAGDCWVSNVCPSSGCNGEDCTRITELAHLIHQPGDDTAVLEAGRTGDEVTDNWHRITLAGSHEKLPAVIVAMQSFNGSDPAGLRLKPSGTTRFDVKVEEEKSKDSEEYHAAETVGYLAVGHGPIKDASGVAIGEAGSLRIRQNDGKQWQRVAFSRRFDDPVVFPQVTTYAGDQPCHTRLRRVKREHFEVQIEEWDYLDQGHAAETVSYIVMERGSHTLAGNRRVQVGRERIDSQWKRVDFTGFSEAPLVFSHVQTFDGSEAVVTRQRKITRDGFDLCLQEEEANDGKHKKEDVGFLAILPS